MSAPDLPRGVAVRLLHWLHRHTEHGLRMGSQCNWTTLHHCAVVYALARRGWEREAVSWLDIAECDDRGLSALSLWAAHLAKGQPMDVATQGAVYVDAGLADTIAVLAAQVNDTSLLKEALQYLAASLGNDAPNGDMPIGERLHAELMCSQVPGRARAHADVYPPAEWLTGTMPIHHKHIDDLSVDGAEVLLEKRLPGNNWRHAFHQWLRVAARCGREATLLPPPEEWRAYTQREQYRWLLDDLADHSTFGYPDLFIHMANLMREHFSLTKADRRDGLPSLATGTPREANAPAPPMWRDFHYELWIRLYGSALAVSQCHIYGPNGPKSESWLLSARTSTWLEGNPTYSGAKLVREARRWYRERLDGGRPF